MTNVSLTGRDWPAFDTALIEGREMIGVLTDGRHTPDVIARHMLEYGYDNYTMTVGQRLGNDAEERIVAASLADIAAMEFAQPNCLILQRTRRRQRPLGIADESLEGLPGRPAMITKRAVRLSTLAALDLRERRCLWDVGFCTGSVSIEARLQFSTLEVVAFERRPECEAIINTNIRRYGAAGIRVVMGDFMEADTSGLPSPDAIFIGGHGGRLAEMVMRLAAMLPAGGVLVLNSVSDESRHTFIDAAGKAGLTLHPEETLKVDSHNPITILKASR
jgi:precorrin-6Y C5,15-methyltransferase (decarboxylating)